jgi:hypothetical protein
MRRATVIQRVSRSDKEFHFQNWVAARLDDAGLQHDSPGRNSYPDFTLVHHPEGYEVKGLQWPGREAGYDSNSRVPTGMHNGRTTYYVFGRYPANADDPEYPVIDLVLCHSDFLNADHTYVHENKSFRGFGSYGDLLVRDRKMYVAPTPFALTSGTTGQATLIAPGELALDGRLEQVGELVRIETDGKQHRFAAYRLKGMGSGTVSMKNLEQVEEQPLSDEE